jgi:hypothetical protein
LKLFRWVLKLLAPTINDGLPPFEPEALRLSESDRLRLRTWLETFDLNPRTAGRRPSCFTLQEMLALLTDRHGGNVQ